MFMLNKIYLNLNLNQFSWLLNKHKLYEKLRIRNRGFEIPNHLTKDSNPDSNPMCYISKGFESSPRIRTHPCLCYASCLPPYLMITVITLWFCLDIFQSYGQGKQEWGVHSTPASNQKEMSAEP